MTLQLSWQRLRQYRSRRWLFVFLVLAGVALLFLGVLPELLRRALTARLAAATAAEVHVAYIGLNPLRGSVTLKDLSVTLPGDQQPAITVQELDVNLAISALLQGHNRVEAVSLSGVRVEAIQQPDGQLNLSRLLPQAEVSTPGTELPVFTVGQLTLTKGQIRYYDRTCTPPPVLTLAIQGLQTDEIAFRATGLSTPIAMHVKGQLNESPLQGRVAILWQRTQTDIEVHIDVHQLALSMLKPYLRHVPAAQYGSGQVGGRLHYRYRSGEGVPAVHALDGALTVQQIRVTDPLSGQTIVDLPTGEVRVEKVDFLAREVRLAAVHFAKVRLLFSRDTTGLNWAMLIPPDPSTEPGARHGQATSPWRFSLQEVRLTGGELRYREYTWADTEFIAAMPEEIMIRDIEGGTTESPLHFRARLGDGSLTGEGTFQFSPFSLRLQVHLSHLHLAHLQPLLTHLVTGTQVGGSVTGTVHTTIRMQDGNQTVDISGTIDTAAVSVTGFPEAGSQLGWQSGGITIEEGSTLIPLAAGLDTQLALLTFRWPRRGNLTIGQMAGSVRLARQEETAPYGEALETDRGETTSTRIPPVASYFPALFAHGTVRMSDIVLKDPQDQQTWLACQHGRAELQEGSRLLPLALHIRDLALEYPYGQFVRASTGQFAFLAPLAATDEQAHTRTVAQDDTVTAPVPFSIRIDRTTVRGGEIFFADETLTPPQTVSWQDVELDLTDLHYPPPQVALLALRAFNEDGAPIRLHGTLEHTDQQRVMKVRGEVQRLSLPRFNPYLATLGYPVREGALSLRFDLIVPGNRLQANSEVTLHDLGLGNAEGTVALEKQIGLPLSLVVALLKDLHGNITLQVPIQGKLDEPHFQLGGTILRAIRDAIVGAVTSPLKVLGAVFTKKGQIRNFTLTPITFLPGTSQYSEQGQQQLVRLGEFLSQRPELSVQLQGYTGPADVEVLKDRVLLEQLRQPSPSMAPQQPVPPASAGIASQATPLDEIKHLLASRLGQVHGTTAPTLSAEASTLLAQLRAQAVVPAQDLERLAGERVQKVITDLTTRHTIAASRLRLARGKTPGREGTEVRYVLQSIT
jgi:uncharacterized protein involved in outer membrane biogenesis